MGGAGARDPGQLRGGVPGLTGAVGSYRAAAYPPAIPPGLHTICHT